MSRIAILGGGSWGTGLSVVLAHSRRKHEIRIWVREASLVQSMQQERKNSVYLPGIPIPACVQASNDLDEVLREVQILIGAVPSAHARGVYLKAAPYLSAETVIVSATKGLEPSTHLRMSEVIGQVFALQFIPRTAVVSGPSFALEAARGDPTAVVLASQDRALAAFLQEEFAGSTFRLYTNEDMLGVELAGAMKNVMAIAAGACQGLGLGANALAALITRGLAEMTRLTVALGGKAETLSGLAGIGDLTLTCHGELSRNRHVGFELGQGKTLQEILGQMNMVAEGVDTTAALLALARERNVELPITEQVHSILHLANSPRDAIRAIMERPLKRE
ncbi:MAG TPA: NAD(P)H-dependent glycerol-3-phosphate dehydrogenase [Candidatus Acidoferrales bacterium]|jgi:glycerol-3-phosphate dehydrogenase (NAD(P)+)|nr:NAD(P)H-dependent glycerol-3-phosphate dehydrogenase [Candidatus Acidoferrales bacterium]